MSNQTKPKRPNYTIEFKQDAAKLVNEKGYTHKQAADNLGGCPRISLWNE
jgi:transposase